MIKNTLLNAVEAGGKVLKQFFITKSDVFINRIKFSVIYLKKEY
jgi:hypothetical protein